MKNKGFTLIEVLISCMVIAILTSVSFWGYNARKDSMVLRDEASILIAKAESMREKSIGSQYFHDKLPRGGYGIAFNKSEDQQYTVFADCSNNGILNPDGDLGCGISGNFRERIEIINLNPRIRIKAMFTSTANPDQIYITFKFPFPKAVIKDKDNNEYDSATIELEVISDVPKERTIIFNSAGLIYVE